jgi:uncharacterized protein YndB with AHSA1/START domain
MNQQSAQSARADDTTLIIEREFQASPERVYEAWTNPELLQKWWGPEGVTIPDLTLDVREGGSWITTFHSDKMGKRVVSGKYISLEPPGRLVFTWGWLDNGKRGHETEVEIVLAKLNNGTKMTLTQKIFVETEHRDNHGFGWSSSFNKLDELLAQ